MFKRLAVFSFICFYIFPLCAFAIDCQNSLLLADIVACQDDETLESIRNINQVEQKFIKDLEACKSRGCLRRLYKEKADVLRGLNFGKEKKSKLADALTPDRAGVRELASYGKLEPLDSVISRKIIRNEIFTFPYDTHDPEYEKKGVIKPRFIGNSFGCSRGIMDFECRHFLMLSPFDSLPNGLGGAVSIVLLVPKDLQAPKNPGHSEIFYLDKTLEELGYKPTNNCSETDDIFTLFLCGNANLQKQKNIGDEELAKALKSISDKDEAYDLAFADFKRLEEIRQCPTIACIEKKYNDRINYFRQGEYKKIIKPKTMPQNCVIPELPEGYELYGISVEQATRAADVKLSDSDTTVMQNVWINRPGENVVLVLSAYAPTVWDLYTTPQTKLAAVFVGGRENAMLRGLQPETFVSFDCEIGYQRDAQALKYKVSDLGLNSDNAQFMVNKTVVGSREPNDKYVLASGTKGDGVPIKILSGKYGMEQYVERQKLIMLTASDVYRLQKYGAMVEYAVKNPKAFDEDLTGKPITYCPELPKKYECQMGKILYCPIIPDKYECQHKSYLLLEAIDKLPDGLIGDEAIRLYVPKGIPVPNNMGESKVYILNRTLDEMKKADYLKNVLKNYEM